MADKIIISLALSLLAVAIIACHINQSLRNNFARLEEQMLDERRVVGWLTMDENGQLFFIPRRK